MKRALIWNIVVVAIGAVLVLLGGVLGWVAFPAIVESTVADTVAVKNGSDAWDRWIELPLPMYMKVHIYDIQNAEGITNGETPVYIEKGPYVYKETRAKENIDYREEENRAFYNQRSLFEFDADMSVGSEDDLVTVPNIPLISFAQITESIGILSSSISSFNASVEKMFKNQTDHSIFTTVSVHDYLFGELPMYCDYTELEDLDAMLMCAAYSLVAPKTVTIGEDGINTFAFFRYKNDSYDGRYEVNLGLEDVENIGQVLTWNNGTSTGIYSDDSCNAIQGTDSTIFRPNLDDVEELYIYNTDICRTVKLTYKEDTEFQGIAGRRYVADKDVLAGPITNQDNYCYCPQSVNNLTSKGGCMKDGLLELSACQGAPVILSFPHYLFADESYQTVYPNLTATEEDHQIFLDLEPYTGSPLRGASRIQMNIHLKAIPEVDMMKNFQNIVLPVLWMDEGVELNDDLLDMLHEELLDILDILNIVRWVLIGVGIATMACGAGYYFVKVR